MTKGPGDVVAKTPGHIVITGAAGAIGSALARAMRAAWPDTELALVDRADASSVAAVAAVAAEVGGTVHGADLADLDALPALVDQIEENGPIDGLVNCAGVMRVRNVADWRWEDARELIAIDLLAPLRLQDLVVRGMVERDVRGKVERDVRGKVERDVRGIERDLRGIVERKIRGSNGGDTRGDDERRGFIVNVASMAGRVPLKGCAYYGAAKAGLAMASEIARADLGRRGVQVVTVYPGPVRSALEAGARVDYGGAGLFGRLAPTGSARVLATKIMRAIADRQPRVIYPSVYGVGWIAPNLSRWITLGFGPDPVTQPSDFESVTKRRSPAMPATLS